MVEMKLRDFDIEQIAGSGQCFRLNRIEEGRYALHACGEYTEIEQRKDRTLFYCKEEEFERVWSPYFDLSADYGAYKDSIDDKDSYLMEAVQFGQGIRILRQPLWEVIVTFIISQQNHIPRIKKCVETLCTRFGQEKKNFRGERCYTFPEAGVLACLPEDGLEDCGLGYRSRYIWKTARMVSEGEISLENIQGYPYEEAKAELRKLCGVGIKVADCVCLFALHHIDAFPVDTHIKKVLDVYYPEGFPFEQYQGFAGVLQQYAFYYDLRHRQG